VGSGFQFTAAFAAATVLHVAQTLLGLDHPAGLGRALQSTGPDPLALATIALAWFCLPHGDTKGQGGAAADARPAPNRAAGFAVLWLAAFALPVVPVAGAWSAYQFTLVAVGGAVLVALPFARARAWSWLAACAVLLTWHASGEATRAFARGANPWTTTSHVN